MEHIYKIFICKIPNNRKPFEKWFDSLDGQIQRTIALRLDRISGGNFGDCELLRNGVWELRIHAGPGYRVYFGRDGNALVIVLNGGSKRTQSKDIERAIDFWELYKNAKGT